jgi:4-amino-4-deoxy-L-arabinose transferase-like glycosyltransferase
MLSRQAHWGDLIFPHPCSFHVVAAPLAALGPPAFHVAVKVMLALWLAGLALCAAILAHRCGGDRAALLAGACLPLIPASYQIVGLGHLMTLLGCFATSLALTFLTLRLGRLAERSSWWIAAALLGAALLSYFAAVPFLSLTLGLTLLWLWHRGEAARARALAGAGLLGAALAFALYYVNWAWPFLSETVPQLLSHGGSANQGSALSRLLLQPSKLQYTFGSLALPLLAALGLGWRARGDERYVLWPWMALLPIVSLLDVRFNFLLKHHYFTMVPVAVGLGLLLERGLAAGRGGRLASAAGLLALALLALRLAGATAFGWIP